MVVGVKDAIICRPFVHNDGASQTGGSYMAAISHLYRAMTYRGREGQIAWLLHRVTGIGVFLFLVLHIVDIFLMSFGPDVFDNLLFIYHKFLFKLLIVFGLYLGVLYHALNGSRVVMIDLWPGMARHQERLTHLAWLVLALVLAPLVWVTLGGLF